MRRTTHRTTLALAALTLLLAGCSGQAGGDGTSVSPKPSTSSSPSAGSEACTPHGVLNASDSGRTVCLATGAVLRVELDGTPKRPWKPLTADGSGLEATNSGFVLQPGDASAAFKAVSPGKIRLTSSRPLCAAETGRISCKGIQEWWVTVVVK